MASIAPPSSNHALKAVLNKQSGAQTGESQHQGHHVDSQRHHDFVRVHEVAGGEVLGFAQGSFGVFDHDIFFALSAGFMADGLGSYPR